MTKFLGHSSVLVLAAFAMAAAPQAASAQRAASVQQQSNKAKESNDKSAPLKFSKKVQPILAKVQKAQQEEDQQGALALLDEADAVPDKNQDDSYMIAMMRLNSAIALKDNAVMEKALEGALATGRIEPAEAVKFHRNLGSLALQRNDFAKALAEFEQVMAADPSDTQLMVEIAELERRQGNDQKAIATINRAIAAKAAAGEKAEESWYRRTLAIAYDKSMANEVAASSLALLEAYPSATNWRDALVIYREGNKIDDQGNLDILRLMRANSALTGERDYLEYATTAILSGFPGEAKQVLDEGVSKGALQASTPAVKEMLDSVNSKVKADHASLAGLEKEANTARNGRSAMGTADAYLGYGEYAKAAALYKLALSKGEVDTDAANTRLGFALAKSGDRAGADAAFAAVSSAPRAQLAKYYTLWANSQS